MDKVKKQTMQFRVSEEEKKEIEHRAQIMGIKTSKFLRELADRKSVV